MSDHSIARSPALLAVPLALAALLSACGNEPNAPAQQTATEQPAAEGVQSAAPKTADPAAEDASNARLQSPVGGKAITRELTIEELSGGWRVTRVEGAKPGSEIANMTGAIAEIYPESASWSYKPKGAGALNDFCQEPVAGIIESEQAQRAVKDRFAKGGKDVADQAVPHELMCASGGSFGDSDGGGTDIALIKPGTMAMTWEGGAILILEKMDRPQPKEDMKPEDYRASDYNRE